MSSFVCTVAGCSSSRTPLRGPSINEKLAAINLPLGLGVQNLQPGSRALRALGATEIPSHAIATTVLEPDALFQYLVSRAFFAIANVQLDFSEALGPGDGIVPLASQTAGMSSPFVSIVSSQTSHIGQTSSIDVYRRAAEVLDAPIEPAIATSVFARQIPVPYAGGGANYTLESCPAGIEKQRNSYLASHAIGDGLTVEPAAGSVIAPGSSVVFTIRTSDLVTLGARVMGRYIEGTVIGDRRQVEVPIPENSAPGRLHVELFGSNGHNADIVIETHLVISGNVSDAQLTPVPESVSFSRIGESVGVTVMARMPDGSMSAIGPETPGARFSIESADPQPAFELLADSTVRARRRGVAALRVSTDSSTVSIPLTLHSSSFRSGLTAIPSVLYTNIYDERPVLFSVPLPGDLTSSDIRTDSYTIQPALAGFTMVYSQPGSRELRFTIPAASVVTASGGGSTLPVTLSGTTQDGATWEAFGNVELSNSGAKVPAVAGMMQAAAETSLRGAGLNQSTSTYIASAHPRGVVISQSPVHGSYVDSSTVVNLVLSEGPPSQATPERGGGHGGLLAVLALFNLLFVYSRRRRILAQC